MHRSKRDHILRSLLLLSFAVMVVTACLPRHSQAQTDKNLLILNSYAPGYKWTDEIILGISDVVRKADKTVRIHQEFMDTKRVSDPEYFRLLYETYRYKFGKTSFDAIVTSDNDAFDFMLQYRERLFNGTPLVFCGVNDFHTSRLHGKKPITGVNEAPDLKATLDLALKLHPKTRKVVVINDVTTTGRALHNQLVKLLPAYQDRVKFVLLEAVEMSEVLEAAEKLEPDTLVFYLVFSRDKTGKEFSFDRSISLIAQRSPVPIYGVWDFNLGYGMVGGMLTSGYNQGRTAGQLAVRVLRGEKADGIPVVMTSPNRYMFDYRQLRRFGIDPSDLPAQSIVINRPAHRYSFTRDIIWGAVATLVLLMLVILILSYKMVLKERGEERLRQLNEELERRVRQRTDELQKNQNALEEQNLLLQKTCHGLKAETEERIRVMEELRAKDQLLIHQSRMAAMGEMLGNIAHQWRQPLNVLGLSIQELGLSYNHGGFSKELLDASIAKVMAILRYLSETIDDFRCMSAPDKEKVTFRVAEVIAKTVSLVADGCKDQGITLQTVIDGEPEIYGYPNEYAQVLLNILINSRDAFQERRIADGCITVRSWTENGRTEVIIADNAGGIEESILEKIFDAYFTTKEQGKGTGVGLFMAKTIIEKNMGGRLTVRNVGAGAEFRISI